jgi:uncharacterized tellurite resistance protein B-like protein
MSEVEEMQKEMAERIKRNCELVLAYLRDPDSVPIEVEIEETINDIKVRVKEAEALEKMLEKFLEKEGEKSEAIAQCTWWISNESLFLSSIISTLKRSLEELRRRQK